MKYKVTKVWSQEASFEVDANSEEEARAKSVDVSTDDIEESEFHYSNEITEVELVEDTED
jgi:hypothetical protein